MDKRSYIRKMVDGCVSDVDYFMARYEHVDDVLKKIPRYEALDKSVASEVATISLGAADECTGLIAEVTHEAEMLYVKAKEENAKAQLDRCSYKTSAQQKVYSQKDERYLDAQKKYINAKTLMEALQRKYDVLMALHYMCKDIIKGYNHGYSGDNDAFAKM